MLISFCLSAQVFSETNKKKIASRICSECSASALNVVCSIPVLIRSFTLDEKEIKK